MKKLFALLWALVVLLWVSVAWASDASEVVPSTAMGELLLMVLKLLLTILTGLATWATAKGIKYFEKKTNIDIPKSTEEQLDKWIDDGIDFAFEKSHQHVQRVGKKLSGPAKLQKATAFVVKKIKENKWDDRALEEIEERIDSRLGRRRKDGNSLVPDDETHADTDLES